MPLIFNPAAMVNFRKKARLTQSGLAKLLDTHYRVVQNWESGRNAPRGKNLDALASALGVSVDELLQGSIEVTSSGGPVALEDAWATRIFAMALQNNKTVDEAYEEVKAKQKLPFTAQIPPSKAKPLRSAFNKLQAVRDLAAQGVEKALEMESDDARQLGRLIAQMQKQLLSAMDELDGVLKGD